MYATICSSVNSISFLFIMDFSLWGVGNLVKGFVNIKSSLYRPCIVQGFRLYCRLFQGFYVRIAILNLEHLYNRFDFLILYG